MDSTKLTDIQIPANRQRKQFDSDSLVELADSIAAKGLLHPIVVRLQDGASILTAGERRLRACKILLSQGKRISCGGIELEEGCVPTLPMQRLTELEYEEAELEENALRVDLTWQEKLDAEQRLHRLRLAQNPEQSYADTAAEIHGEGISDSHKRKEGSLLKRDAKLYEALQTNPELAKAKTKKEAAKIVARQATDTLNMELAALANKQDIECFDAKHTNLKGDCLDIMSAMPSESFEIILTDPPYGVNAQKFGDQSDRGHQYDDSVGHFKDLMAVFAEESFRVATAQAHLYMFFAGRHYQFLVDTFSEAGWDVWHAPIIWSKGNGMLPRPEHAPRRTYESILYCIKGNMPVRKVAHDVISMSPPSTLQHGAQKPVALYEELLNRSAYPGFKVLDAFAGSGTIFPAATRAGCDATGINISEVDYALAQSRLLEE